MTISERRQGIRIVLLYGSAYAINRLLHAAHGEDNVLLSVDM